jgi:DNA-binding XRE family transcriptional regulator
MYNYNMFVLIVNRYTTTDGNECCNIPNMTFVTWLETELNKRNWKRSDLARATGLSDTAITLVINGKRNPGTEMCLATAKAFQLPPESVYRHAGLLPADRL